MENNNDKTKYPTKEQIMEKEQIFKMEVIKIVKDWKETDWKFNKNLDAKQKYLSLEALALNLGIYYKKPIKVSYQPTLESCIYSPVLKTICLNQSLSVISLLHEFAHHLLGSSEFKACRWSVWLFKKTFPKSFEQLKWKGHMLIK